MRGLVGEKAGPAIESEIACWFGGETHELNRPGRCGRPEPPMGADLVAARGIIRRRRLERHVEGYLELGMPEQALETLAKLGEPDSFGAHRLYLWGEALRSLERYEEAVIPLQRAAEANPDNSSIWLALAWCHKRVDRLDRAIVDIESALVAEPEEALLHYNLACYLSLAGRRAAALEHLAQALSIEPGYRRLIDDESDFDPLRDDAEFQSITSVVV